MIIIKTKAIHPKPVLCKLLFATYLCTLFCISFLFPRRERTSHIDEWHIIPLQSTLAQIHDPAQYNTPDYWFMFTVSIGGNILSFIPLGIFLKLLSNKQNSYLVLTGFFISASIEFLQLFFHTGVCDIDDVLLNVTGCLGGIFIAIIIQRSLKRKTSQDQN